LSVPIFAVPFFAGLSGDDRTEIMLQTRSRKFAAGQQVSKEDDATDGMFVVLSGVFRVYLLGRGAGVLKKVLVFLKPGAYLGDFGLINGQPRSASVECEIDGGMLFLPALSFVKVESSRSSVAKIVMENLYRTVTDHKGIVYGNEELRQRIRAAQIPPTVHNVKAICKMLRVNNYSIARS